MLARVAQGVDALVTDRTEAARGQLTKSKGQNWRWAMSAIGTKRTSRDLCCKSVIR